MPGPRGCSRANGGEFLALRLQISSPQRVYTKYDILQHETEAELDYRNECTYRHNYFLASDFLFHCKFYCNLKKQYQLHDQVCNKTQHLWFISHQPAYMVVFKGLKFISCLQLQNQPQHLVSSYLLYLYPILTSTIYGESYCCRKQQSLSSELQQSVVTGGEALIKQDQEEL